MDGEQATKPGAEDVQLALQRLHEAMAEQKAVIARHRSSARKCLMGIAGVAVLLVTVVFLVLAAASQILEAMVGRLAELMKYPNAAQILGKPLVESAPKIVNDSTPVIVAASGLVVLAFLLIGIARHHVKRSAVAEDRLYDLMCLGPLCGTHAALPTAAVEALATRRDHRAAEFSDVTLHPVVELVREARAAIRTKARR